MVAGVQEMGYSMRYTLSEKEETKDGSVIYHDFYVTYSRTLAHILLWLLSLVRQNLVIVRY